MKNKSIFHDLKKAIDYKYYRLRRWCYDPSRLLKNLTKGLHDLTVLQIGSHDGATTDPIHKLLMSNFKWKAHLVEPVPELFSKLSKNYSVRPNTFLHNLAVSYIDGTVDFYFLDRAVVNESSSLPWWHDQLGSMEPDHINKILPVAFHKYVTKTKVPALTLRSFLEKNSIKSIDLFHIDAEGWDWKILNQLETLALYPKFILFEHKHLADNEKNLIRPKFQDKYKITFLENDVLMVKRH